MNRLFAVFILSFFTLTPAFAADEAATEAAPVVEAAVAEPVLPAVDEAAAMEAPAVPEVDAQNLEFVSGEVSTLDEAARSLTVKLYGEAEQGSSDKLLTIKVDDATDITDGEKDREFGSLAAGTEVDVEYDPASNKATYIFVY